MRETRLIMGIPITVEVVDASSAAPLEAVFDYFEGVDARFSPFKSDSEVAGLNSGAIEAAAASEEMQEVLRLAAVTKTETGGFFDIRRPDGRIDPSGLVKGWAISKAAALLAAGGHRNYCVEAGGDIQCAGCNAKGEPWRIGIRNPFNHDEIVKVLQPGDAGVATSGSYVRGAHVYDPLRPDRRLDRIVSLTVIAGDIYDADRFATAAFAMGQDGIHFLEATPGLEGYAIDTAGIATMSSGFKELLAPC